MGGCSICRQEEKGQSREGKVTNEVALNLIPRQNLTNITYLVPKGSDSVT
jgi:hypothetical protein